MRVSAWRQRPTDSLWLLITVGLLATAVGTLAQTATSPSLQLQPSDPRVEVGAQVGVDLVLTAAPTGLRSYEAEIAIRDGSVAHICCIQTGVVDESFFQVLAQTETSVEFRALDFQSDTVSPGDRNVLLAQIGIVGRSAGQTQLDVTPLRFVDDEGQEIAIHDASGVVRVRDPSAVPVGDSPRPPQDLDGDGLYEDVNGDGELTSDDVVLLAFHIQSEAVQQQRDRFDFDGDGDVDLHDARALAGRLGEATPMETTLRLEDAVVQAGSRAQTRLLLLQAPNGLRAFDVEISAAADDIVRIMGAESLGIDPRFVQTVRLDPSSIRLRGVDFHDRIRPGARDVALVAIRFQGVDPGETALDLLVHRLVSDQGDPLEPQVSPGQVETVASLNPIGDATDPPQDLDGDGRFEDVDGDGTLSFDDPIHLALFLDDPGVQNHPDLFDFDGDDDVDFDDTVALVRIVEEDLAD